MQVIWVIGVSMIVLGGIDPSAAERDRAFGLAMIACTIYSTPNHFRCRAGGGPGSAVPGAGAKLWMILHQPGDYRIL